MRDYRRPAAAAAAAAALLLAAPAATAAAMTAPPATTSYYVSMTGTRADLETARDAGCAQGRTGLDGLRVLFLGTQERGNVLRPPGTRPDTTAPRVAAARGAAVAAQWARGFTECRVSGATAVLALGVNNKSDGHVDSAAAGRAWARTVTAAARRATTDAVAVAGAVDAEPSWSSPAWARAWVDAFTSASPAPLFTMNSADGCPVYGSTSTACGNGWTVADVHYVSAGASPALVPVPQIYRTDGIQARQWANVSAWGVAHGHGPVRFGGALSQSAACAQRGCARTDNTPEQAWTQLFTELNSHEETRLDSLPYSTDMSWPR
ncbi:hypothetical protein [Actinorugispora endophytica]|uniref:Uncharacterized protein n=1 Tax=Actinorugispora endophytica TaxID=1605990 RepID=A0A4R6USK1_9ACTN|nr:hypothetical protein [Actinorugispora endophytica]TDQ46344.1 hypothetical protein EV190_12531 [Actinorugispora endophytica]